ncbi:MAG: MauE/DoxX family redox-associated membrane protein [Elusimicrobiota bacterium]|jgi:uncharacterized membrane protein YphA (DoxX/SURF4 family)
MAMTVLALLLRLLIGGVLCYAGFEKAIASSAEFAAVIQAYRLLPNALAIPLASSLPWLEMWIGTFLIFGYFTRRTAGLAAGLFAVLITAVGSTLLRHIDLASCGCFGSDRLSPRWTILLDFSLLAGSIVLIWLTRRTDRFAVDSFLKAK